jgi:hypothetical protein
MMYLRHDLSVGGFFGMEDRAPGISSSDSDSTQSISQLSLQSSATRRLAGRGAWVLTAYGISALALFGVLAYFFSDFIAR